MLTIYFKIALEHGISYYDRVKSTLANFARDYPNAVIIKSYAE